MIKFSSVKLVLWDVDGTIFDFFEAQKNAIRSCFAKFNMGECSDEMLIDYDGINHKYWKALERGEITKPQVLSGRFMEFFGKYGIDTSLVDAFNDEYQIRLGDTVCMFQGAQEVINKFKKLGIRQFVVTNGTKVAQDRKLAASGLDKIFDAVFISEVVGYEKPDPKFFESVYKEAKRLIADIDLEEIAIIGDSLTSDMQLGNNVGIKTCWFNTSQLDKNVGSKNGQFNTSQSDKTDLRIDMEIKDFYELLS